MTYRHPADDVANALRTLEDLLEQSRRERHRTTAVDQLVVRLGPIQHGEGIDLRIVVEELRAQLEEEESRLTRVEARRPKPTGITYTSTEQDLREEAVRLAVGSGAVGSAVLSSAEEILGFLKGGPAIENDPADVASRLLSLLPSDVARRADLVVATLPDGSHRIVKQRGGTDAG